MLRLWALLRAAGAVCLAVVAACDAGDDATPAAPVEAAVVSGAQVLPQMGHPNSVEAVAFSPDGRLAASVGMESSVKLWDLATGREMRGFLGHTAHVKAVAFSPDGRFIVTGGSDRHNNPSLRLWDVATGKQLLTFDSPSVTSVAF